MMHQSDLDATRNQLDAARNQLSEITRSMSDKVDMTKVG